MIGRIGRKWAVAAHHDLPNPGDPHRQVGPTRSNSTASDWSAAERRERRFSPRRIRASRDYPELQSAVISAGTAPSGTGHAATGNRGAIYGVISHTVPAF